MGKSAFYLNKHYIFMEGGNNFISSSSFKFMYFGLPRLHAIFDLDYCCKVICRRV